MSHLLYGVRGMKHLFIANCCCVSFAVAAAALVTNCML